MPLVLVAWAGSSPDRPRCSRDYSGQTRRDAVNSLAVPYGADSAVGSTRKADGTGQGSHRHSPPGHIQQMVLQISIRGELAVGCNASAPQPCIRLGPLRAWTMKQPFASSARL